MIHACLYLLAGVYALQLSSFATGSDLIATALVAFFIALFFRAWRGVSWSLLGVGLFAVSAAGTLADRLAPGYAGDSIVARVRIADFPVYKDPSLSFVAVPLDDQRLSERIRLSWFEPPDTIAFGDVWELELRLRRPRGNLNPGSFDYEAWLFRAGIGATGYVVAGRRNVRLHAGMLGPIERVRQRVVTRLTQLPLDSGNVAVLAAISVGARHLLGRDQWERYARTGTSHLMAISGLHISLAAGGAYILSSIVTGLILRRGNYHATATATALCVAAVYGGMSGLALPAQRATVMIALLAAAVVRRRQPRPITILAASCVLLTVLSPTATMAPGFKLSFAAVLILIWLARRMARIRQRSWHARLSGAVCQLGAVQVLLLLGLMPLTAGIFGRVSLVAPAINLIAVPVFSFVTVPFTLGGIVLDGPLEPVGDRLLLIASWSVGAVESLIEIAADWPGAASDVAELQRGGRLCLLMPLLWAALPPGWPGRGLAWLGLLALVVHEPRRPAPGCLEIEVLDVGQGLSIVLRDAEHVLLYDTGPAFRGGRSMAEAVVLPHLASRGIDRIDTLIISHADLDHAGGVRPLLQGMETGTILAGEALPGLSSTYQLCRTDAEWVSGGIRFRIVHPVEGSAVEGNDASCVLLAETGGYRLLVSGDIERVAEDSLVARDALPRVTVAIVPHHGSLTSSSEAFVDVLRPELAIVSAGYRNRWGFPKDDVVERWRAAGARVLGTAESGAISARICAATGLQAIGRHRPDHRRIWHE